MIELNRRTMIVGLAAAVAATGAGAWVLLSGDAAEAQDITVYKSPTCGCCGAWADHLRANGFSVTVEEREDLTPVKTQFGVPARLQSCHTARVAGYTIEGHVPAREIKRLLSERPEASGLAVPGMPIGSPGMEQGSQTEPYQVILFSETGLASYAQY